MGNEWLADDDKKETHEFTNTVAIYQNGSFILYEGGLTLHEKVDGE